MDPDDSRFFCSDYKLKALRIVDPVTLADIAVVSLKSPKAKYFQPGEWACCPTAARPTWSAPRCSDPGDRRAAAREPLSFFCAVVKTESQEVVKRIPLDAY